MKAEPVASPSEAASQPPTIRAASVLKCGLLILFAKTALRLAGFGRTIRWLRRRADAAPTNPTADVSMIVATERSVAMAGALFPGRALCLEQSLVLYYLLRRLGVAAKVRFGVQPYPFLAHSWVECGGNPVNDVPEHVRRFATLPDPPL